MNRTILFAATVLVAGCSPSAPPAAPAQTAPQPGSLPVTSGSSDPSVPSASTVLAPPPDSKPDPNQGRSNSSMTRAQESSAMPMPGQNNDHSAPLSPDKSASAAKARP